MTQQLRALYCPTNASQKAFGLAYRTSDIVLGLGAAGTGKSHAALGLALTDLLSGKSPFRKLWLIRPLVSCDENLGAFPGNLQRKLTPWHAALGDVLDNLSHAKPEELLSRGLIELVPLGLLRGRTISRGIAILDEAQNCTAGQLKLFLSRIGREGKLLLLGDPEQSDLRFPGRVRTGVRQRPGCALTRLARLLSGMDRVGVVEFDGRQNARHALLPELLRRLRRL